MAALKNQCELCVHALDIFASIYGSESGNMALRYLARAGVYLGGESRQRFAPSSRMALSCEPFLQKDG